jgi:hypothetical protein
MEPERAQEIAERDQLWASLRLLRTEIDALANGQFTGSDRERQVTQLLSRIVLAELDYRVRGTE